MSQFHEAMFNFYQFDRAARKELDLRLYGLTTDIGYIIIGNRQISN